MAGDLTARALAISRRAKVTADSMPGYVRKMGSVREALELLNDTTDLLADIALAVEEEQKCRK